MVEMDPSQLAELEALGARLGMAEDAVRASVFAVTRTVTDSIKETTIVKGQRPPPGTLGLVRVEPLTTTTRTRSIKLSNLVRADMGTILEIVAGGVMTGADMAAQPHPIIIAAGLLILIRSFTRALKVELSEREASVFWGLIQACDEGKVAAFDAIVERTNQVRAEAGLDPLSEGEIGLALRLLESIKSVQPAKGKEGAWRIRERWRTGRYSSAGARGKRDWVC
jgi:hypothetical protein